MNSDSTFIYTFKQKSNFKFQVGTNWVFVGNIIENENKVIRQLTSAAVKGLKENVKKYL